MASAATPAVERPCDRFSRTLITAGSPVYLMLTAKDPTSQPHPAEIPDLVLEWSKLFYSLEKVIPAGRLGYITKGTVKEQLPLFSNLSGRQVRLRGCLFTLAALTPEQTMEWAHHFDDSDMDDDLPNPRASMPVENGEVTYLAFTWLKQPPRKLKKQDLLEAAKAFLSQFGQIRSAFPNKEGIYVALLVTDRENLCKAVRENKTHLLGHSVDLQVLDEQSAIYFNYLVPADSDYDSGHIPVSQRSDIDEFATDSMSSGSPSRKEKKKAYKKRAKARKRSLSGSKTDCGPDAIAGTSGQPPKRSALPPANQEPPTAAPTTSIQTSLLSQVGTPNPTETQTAPANVIPTSHSTQVGAPTPTQTSVVHEQPLQETDEADSAPSQQPRNRPAKKARWIQVDFSKVEINVPAPADVTTLLIRPVDPSQQLRDLHPLKLATFLNNTFGPVQALRDIRAGGLAVDLGSPTAKLEAAQATTCILDVQVTVTKPLTAAVCAVVTGVHPDLTESEILTEISSETPVSAVKRLAKPGQKSWAIKLTFSGDTVPDKVRLFGRTHSTKPYSDRPLRCHRCHRFGHPARVCRSAARCMVCSGDHLSESCPQPEQPKCCNCGGPHSANSSSCPALAFQAKVISVKQANNTSFKAARKAVTSAARSYASALKGPADQSTSKPTGPSASKTSRAPASSQGHEQPNRPAVTAAISTQTDEVTSGAPPPPFQFGFAQLESLFERILGIIETAAAKGNFAAASKQVNAVFDSIRRVNERSCKGVSPVVPPAPSNLS